MRDNQRYGGQNYSEGRFERNFKIKTMREVGVGQMIGNLEVAIEVLET